MKVKIRWFLTSKESVLEDHDEILSPNTTIAELKGLIQIRFGFSAKGLILIHEGHLLENTITLKSIGVVGQSTDPMLMCHTVREGELEDDEVDPNAEEAINDEDIHEFSHADFIMAMKMLGKDVPVPDDRLVAMRMSAPRQRPAFLDMKKPQEASGEGGDSAAPPTGMPGVAGGAIPMYDPKKTEVHQILAQVRYGARKEGVDEKFSIHYPEIAEPLAFWDMRAPDVFQRLENLCSPGEVCVELFYFGEFEAIKDHQSFLQLVTKSLESNAGVRLRTPFPIREAGCMYPLIACPIILHEMDAMELGDIFFEDFGKGSSGPTFGTNGDMGPPPRGGGALCAPQ